MGKILKLATHAAADVAAAIEQYDSLKQALEPYHYVVGTTARVGGERQIMGTPADISEHLIPISAENRVAIVFGSEDRGLLNEDIRLCHVLVNIPTAEFSSLNRDILVRISYVNPENPDYWLNHIRHFFTRIQLRAKEVSIIRGLCRQIDWYAGKCYKDGVNGRNQD